MLAEVFGIIFISSVGKYLWLFAPYLFTCFIYE